MTSLPSPDNPRARWLTARIVELDVDVAHLSAAIAKLNGRLAFDSECALEDAIAERAVYRRELSTLAEVTP